MIELVVLLAGAVGAGWLIRRAHLRRVAAGPATGIPCMARTPAGAGRWRIGQVFAGPDGARWVPRRGESVDLAGGRATGVRAPSVKEGMSINPGSRIVACAYGGGGSIEIAVMPLDLGELLRAVPQDEAPQAG
ncbi:hypothetical protein AB0953_34505 [Streptomyces sp. NPDC046866]|uniref:hypothetical protein n=1 Tax=Streptomyces sp. NPDC046866 TaxID=3154921 RepID=UPI003453CD86